MGFFQSLLLLVALAVVLLGYRLSTFARVAPGLKNSVGWQCERFEHPGTEDFATDGKRVYISTVDFPCALAHAMNFSSCPQGYITRYNLETFERMTVTGAPPGFLLYPHGVSLVEDRLFVVNHSPVFAAKVGVTIFRIDGTKLVHERDVESSTFLSLNAVKGLSVDGEFLAVNDHGTQGPLLQFAEDLFGLKRSALVMCSAAGACRVVVDDLESTAPGVEVRDGKVYVSQCLTNRIAVFDRSTFRRLGSIPLETCPDNLHFDAAGTLWTGGHPHLLQAFGHILMGRPAPAHVVSIDVATGEARTEFYQDAEHAVVSGVATGQVVGDALLLGTVRDGFGVCKKQRQQ